MERVKIKNWTSFTTSEILANDFGMLHCNILKIIQEIPINKAVATCFFRDMSTNKTKCLCGVEGFQQEITRDGFSLLIPHLRDTEKIICYLGEFSHADLKINRVDNLKKKENSDDPWKHRSKGLKCKTCMWFVKKENSNDSTVGRCRKNAPTMGGYPVVLETDWCGAHRLNENAL